MRLVTPGKWLSGAKLIAALLALALGVCIAYAVHAYVLIDLFPVTGKRLLALTGAAGVAGAMGAFVLVEWLGHKLRSCRARQVATLLGLSLVTSLVLFYVAGDAWTDEQRYPSFALPVNRLEVRVSGEPGAEVWIEWMTTSLGELSFSGAEYTGWERVEDRLRLVDGEENRLTWRGKTGDEVRLVMRAGQEGQAQVWLNGEERGFRLEGGGGQQTLVLTAGVPWYARRGAAQIGAVAALWAMALGLMVALAGKEQEIRAGYERGVARFTLAKGQAVYRAVEEQARWEAWAVTLLVAAALLLRVFNLDHLAPYTDEYFHLQAAKNLLNGAGLGEVYERGLYLVTLPVAAFFKVFGLHVWAARLPGVVVNALGVIPLYLLGRKMNRAVALLAGVLYATSPWVIAVARDVREYAYYPFYFYGIVYGMVIVLEKLPNGIVLGREFWKQARGSGWIVPGLLLILPVVYGLSIDWLSTFKVIFIAYGVFALFLLAKLDWRSPANRLPLGVLIGGTIVIVALFLDRVGFISFDPAAITRQPLQMFFPEPQQQWYFGRWTAIPMLAVAAAAVVAVWQPRRSFIPLFAVLLLAAYLAFFSFLFSRYFKPRYIVSVQLWYIPVLAIGLYFLWLLLKTSIQRSGIRLAVVILAALVSLNPAQSLLPTLYNQNGFMPVTLEYHYEVELADQYIRQRMTPADALISTIYANHVRLYGKPVFSALMYYDPTDADVLNTLIPFVNQHASGWIVIDINRYGDSLQPPPQTSFRLGNAQVAFMHRLGDNLIWRWQIDPGSGN